MKLLSFTDAMKIAHQEKHVHALLGNGFSRACRNEIFAYDALFNRADFKKLSPSCRQAFEALKTTDFEVVIRALKQASALARVYLPEDKAISKMMFADAEKLREVLVSAIADSHPAWPGEIDREGYKACKSFLAHFERVYTANYDLLLYWAYMQDEIPPDLECDDGFRRPDSGDEEYVSWEVDNSHDQRVFYIHGALHLFDSGPELQKYTWKNTGIRLVDQIRAALKASKFPLFVSEGTSDEKLIRIKHSGYLHRALASLPKISGSLVIYGLSLAVNDEHILRLLEKGRISNLFISVFGDPDGQQNKSMIARAKKLAGTRTTLIKAGRKLPPLNLHYYDAETANVWG